MLAVVASSYSTVRQEFALAALGKEMDASSISLVPVAPCNDARGVRGTDYNEGPYGGAPYLVGPFCWYELPKFRRLYPEYVDLSDQTLLSRL
jgi:hypothetical protein